LTLARKVPATQGSIYNWSLSWAGGTLTQARKAVQWLTFGPQSNRVWTVPLTGHYDDSMAPIKKRQLTEAGARLAQTLKTIWP
jgi:hypothetical protein